MLKLMLNFASFFELTLKFNCKCLLVRSKGMVDQKLKVTLITGRTIDQGVGKEPGKGSKEYFENAAVCFIDVADMKKLGIRNGTNVRVTTQFGSVIVKGIKAAARCQSWNDFHALRFMGKCCLRRRHFHHGYAPFQGIPS